ncbi:hypothetical protein FO519_010396, partial [Halicephalobus sp. NKZ332]
MTSTLVSEAGKVGLRINKKKTKVMAISRKTKAKISIGTESIEEVDHFQYLGSCITKEGGTDTDIHMRLGKATALFRKMSKIWQDKMFRKEVKIRLFNTIIIPTAIYAGDTWKDSNKTAHQLNTFQQRCLRKILNISYSSKTTNEEVLIRSGSHRLADTVTERRMRLAGHILRLPDHRYAKSVLNWTPPGGKRKQ